MPCHPPPTLARAVSSDGIIPGGEPALALEESNPWHHACSALASSRAHLVDKAGVGIPAALRFLHELGVAPFLRAKQVDVEHRDEEDASSWEGDVAAGTGKPLGL